METADFAALMDRNYRYQRHFYDLTRRHYLLGRDRLLRDLQPPRGGTVLEIGCGTGRNLIAAATLYPHARFHGVDISKRMLATAEANVAAARHRQRIVLAEGDATSFDPNGLFGLASFDRVFFSYSLSMISRWRDALERAVGLTACPGGRVALVDFGQQEGLPRWFRVVLFAWLSHFHVTPRADLEQALSELVVRTGGGLQVERLFRGYVSYAVVDRDPAALKPRPVPAAAKKLPPGARSARATG